MAAFLEFGILLSNECQEKTKHVCDKIMSKNEHDISNDVQEMSIHCFILWSGYHNISFVRKKKFINIILTVLVYV